MVPAAIAAASSVVVILITTVGQWLSNRNDRALAHQEVELLQKLQPNSRTAKDLEQVIASRIDAWKLRQQPAAVRHRAFAFWAILAYVFGVTASVTVTFTPQDLRPLIIVCVAVLPVGVCSYYAARNLRRSHNAAKGKFWPLGSRNDARRVAVEGAPATGSRHHQSSYPGQRSMAS
jgi:Flp pilus assembly protein TadB